MASTDPRIDDPVERLVELAMQAQTRLMLAYMERMRDELREHLEQATRREFGGERTYLRKVAPRWTPDERRNKVHALRKSGLTVRQIAKELTVSKTQVSRDLEDCREADHAPE